MATITASTFQNLFNDASISATHAEEIIDLAIDIINLYSDSDVPNMTGTAGSKSVSVESKQKGAIFILAEEIYHGLYQNPTATSVMGQSISPANAMANPTIRAAAKEAARMLTELDITYG
jgi:hypothetical protein